MLILLATGHCREASDAIVGNREITERRADDDITRYKSTPASATAGATTIVFENSAATGNTTGMPHTLTFDTTTEGYNHDVNLNILASPFDTNNGRHQATVTAELAGEPSG